MGAALAGQRRGRGPTRVGGRRLPRLRRPRLRRPRLRRPRLRRPRLRRAGRRGRDESDSSRRRHQRHDVVGGLYQLGAGPGAAAVLRLAAGRPPTGAGVDPVPGGQRTGRAGAAAGAARAPPRPGPSAGRRRALPGPGVDPHRRPSRAAARGRAAALRRRGPHLRPAPPRAPGLGAAGRARGVRRGAADAAGGVVGQGQHPPALGRHPRRPLRHSTHRGPGPARGLPRRAQTRHGLRLPDRACLPAGAAVLVGGPADQPQPGRPAHRPADRRRMAGTIRPHRRRPRPPRNPLRPVRHPRPLPRPGRVGPRRPHPLGHLGRALPGPAHPVPRRREGQAAPARPHPGPHPPLTPLLPAFVAARHARRDWGRDCSTPPAPPATASSSSSTVSGSPAAGTPAATTTCGPPSSGPRSWTATRGAAVPTEHGRVNITRLEDDGFWAWAIIETLRHTGIRIEELLELTQLSLRHYTPPRRTPWCRCCTSSRPRPTPNASSR